MKKLNNKGYMLVEIIVASVIAFSVAYYLLNLTYKFKNKNEDVYFTTTMMSDKINITKNIMDDLDGNVVTYIYEEPTGSSYIFTLKDDSQRKISITEKKIEYGKIDNSNNFKTTDSSYYTKTLSSTYEFGKIAKDNRNNILTISIPLSNIYEKENSTIKLVIEIEENSSPATGGSTVPSTSEDTTTEVTYDCEFEYIKLNSFEINNIFDVCYYNVEKIILENGTYKIKLGNCNFIENKSDSVSVYGVIGYNPYSYLGNESNSNDLYFIQCEGRSCTYSSVTIKENTCKKK